MQRRLLALAASVSLSFALAVSPAQTAYNEAAFLLKSRYSGLSTVDRAALVDAGQRKLDEACAASGENCAFDEAYKIIAQNVAALGDNHSSFRSPRAYQDFVTRQTGGSTLQYGVKLRNLDGGGQVVYETVPGSAAADAGLRRGDRLLKLDGQPYTFELLTESKTKGSPVALELMRAGVVQTVQIQARESTTRDLPRLEYVNDVAVLRIPTFSAGGGIAQGVHDLVREAKARSVRGIIVDLRDNGGGSVAECDLAVSAFVPQFERVSKLATGEQTVAVSNGAYQVGRGAPRVQDPTLWDGPVSVLVSRGSASCAEFFAREVQYAKRGAIIGEATAGVSNTATLIFPIAGGAAVQLTTVYYAKPDGVPYPERVLPEVAASDDFEQLSRGVDVVLDKGIAALRSSVAAK